MRGRTLADVGRHTYVEVVRLLRDEWPHDQLLADAALQAYEDAAGIDLGDRLDASIDLLADHDPAAHEMTP